MSATGNGTMAKVGVGGTISGYGVVVLGDTVVVERDGVTVARRVVAGLGRFVAAARDVKLGRGRVPDGGEAIYLSDAGDGGFGYALNLASGRCSEWGYAPFGGSAPLLPAANAPCAALRPLPRRGAFTTLPAGPPAPGAAARPGG